MDNCADRHGYEGKAELRGLSPIRSFISVPIPASVRIELADVQKRLRERCREVKWIRSESMHITLKFLGDVNPGMVDALKQALESAVSESQNFRLKLNGLGRFPNSGKPRILWAGISEGAEAVKRLAERVDTACASLGFEREKRPFSPHITIGRVRHDASMDAGRCLQNVELCCESFEVGELHLMKSDLQPSGAVYTVIHSIKLEG